MKYYFSSTNEGSQSHKRHLVIMAVRLMLHTLPRCSGHHCLRPQNLSGLDQRLKQCCSVSCIARQHASVSSNAGTDFTVPVRLFNPLYCRTVMVQYCTHRVESGNHGTIDEWYTVLYLPFFPVGVLRKLCILQQGNGTSKFVHRVV